MNDSRPLEWDGLPEYHERSIPDDRPPHRDFRLEFIAGNWHVFGRWQRWRLYMLASRFWLQKRGER